MVLCSLAGAALLTELAAGTGAAAVTPGLCAASEIAAKHPAATQHSARREVSFAARATIFMRIPSLLKRPNKSPLHCRNLEQPKGWSS
jgi:hypothetical protein